MARSRLRKIAGRAKRIMPVARRHAPTAGAGAREWGRFVVEVPRYVLRAVFFSSAAAHRYCVGSGLEIGGSAHNPFGLDSRNVDLSDSMDTVFKLSEIATCGRALPVDLVAPGDDLPVDDESQDFVISSHVLEHFADPVRTLLEWDRVVRPGGVIFMIVPHKKRTFDRKRPRTTLDHLIADYETNGAEPHEDPNGHNHVWVTEDIVELVSWMRDRFELPWELLEVQDHDDKVGNGFTVVIGKRVSQ